MKRNIIIAVAVIAGILAAVAIISILAQTPVPIGRFHTAHVRTAVDAACAGTQRLPGRDRIGNGMTTLHSYVMLETE